VHDERHGLFLKPVGVDLGIKGRTLVWDANVLFQSRHRGREDSFRRRQGLLFVHLSLCETESVRTSEPLESETAESGVAPAPHHTRAPPRSRKNAQQAEWRPCRATSTPRCWRSRWRS